MSIMIVILLLTYLVTSADSAILVVNTIGSGGSESQATNKHVIIWGVALGGIVGALLLAGGLGAIQSAMIVGTIPFSFVLILMGIGLLKALIRDQIRENNS